MAKYGAQSLKRRIENGLGNIASRKTGGVCVERMNQKLRIVGHDLVLSAPDHALRSGAARYAIHAAAVSRRKFLHFMDFPVLKFSNPGTVRMNSA
jgi:hypothetical protein